MKIYKHTKFQYATKLPVVVFEMFQQRIMDYHFRGLGEVMNYLLKAYCRMHNKEKVSKTIKRIFSHQDTGWFRLFRYDEKTIFSFETSRELSDRVKNMANLQGYSTRNQLTNFIIGAFIASAHETLRNLSKEMSEQEVVAEIKGTMIATYVSNYQFMFLKQTAEEQRTSLMSLLGSATDLFLQLDEDNADRYVPKVLREIAESVLNIEGYTTKEFRRGKAVAISINDDKAMRIMKAMQKHNIRTPREFLRRVILFFFNARYLIFKDNISAGEDMPICEEIDYDDYFNEQCARKDFARSIYAS